MPKKKHLIIGCGPAALSAIDTLRCASQEDEIKVVSNEESLPYSPAVLPYLLSGRIAESELSLRDAEYFKRLGVTFVTGKDATRIVHEDKRVVYSDGESDDYDTLLIACGASPATQPGTAPEDVLEFHSLKDYRLLARQLDGMSQVTVLGAGMVAVELAVALVERGCTVDIVGRGRPLRAYFDEESGTRMRTLLQERGINIKTGRSVTSIRRDSKGFEVRCADGEVLRTDLAISCLGVNPRLSLIQGSGIQANRGILVDTHMRTNLQSVFAAGDVTEAPSFHNGVQGVCAILPEAIAQGKVAGANMAGTESVYEGWVPMNLLKFFGHSAFSIGAAMPEGGAAHVLQKSDDGHRWFEKLVFSDGKLIGAMFVDVEVDPGVISYLIKKRVNLESYEKALLEQPLEVGRWLMLNSERGNPSV